MDKQTLELIQTYGFPVFVSLWFMLRLERRMEKIVEIQQKTTEAMVKIVDLIERFHK